MNTIIFDKLDSYTDLGLYLNSKTIGSPALKTELVEVPGSDTVLDYSEFSGEVRYKTRTLTFTFSAIHPSATDDYQIKNVLHGKKCKIFLSEDPDYYFYGRLEVGDWKITKGIAQITITATCEPWRYAADEIVVSSGSGTVALSNARKTVAPKVTVTSGSVTLTWAGNSATLSTGTNMTVDNLLLYTGTTNIEITGDGTVTFTYREAVI